MLFRSPQEVSVPEYLASIPADQRARMMPELFPAKLAELNDHFRDMVFIEPEPGAGAWGAVFDACARRLPNRVYSIWRFRTPLDHLFRLSHDDPTHQVVYAFTRDRGLLAELSAYATSHRRDSVDPRGAKGK